MSRPAYIIFDPQSPRPRYLKMTKYYVSNVERFSGKNKITIENWCHLVEDAFTLDELTDKQKLVLASQQLSGSAATWYEATRNSQAPFKTWIELQEGLVKRFGGNKSAAVACLELGRLRWTEKNDL